MSTRSCIARKTDSGFIGVYHHFDGYPNGVGRTLFNLRNSHFKGDTDAMLKFLIDDNKGGWSTIVEADFSLPPQKQADSNLEICDICGMPKWRHYAQYYDKTCSYWVEAGRPDCPPRENGFQVFNHAFSKGHVAEGPIILGDEPYEINERNASGVGCEYAYVFTDAGKTMQILSSYCENGNKMVGAFGFGDPEGTWKLIASVDLDADMPDWNKFE